jgi:cbb3-type cytochrome oxidase cytochrome c subunit
VFEKRSETPIEERNYSGYYLVFSGLLFVGTMWAVVDEVSTRRPWKDHQKEYYELLSGRVKEQLDFTRMYVDSAALAEQTTALRAAEDSMRSSVYLDLVSRHSETLEELIDANREYQFAKSRGDEAYYFYKKSLKEGSEDLGEKERLEENESEMARYNVLIRELEARRDSIQEALSGYRQRLRTTQSAISDLLADVEKWETKLDRVESSNIEIRQVMMLDYDRNPFNDPKARVDRCQTCHLGWNEELAEDLPQPYTKHPVPELLAVHSPEKFGCTPCHRGQGSALTAGFAHGDEDHYWENPLLPKEDTWASCNECHESESSLNHAPQFTKAKRLMIESGCHGCHEIKGYTDLARIGPELNRIGYKTTPEWIFTWLKDPRHYNPRTRMPNFVFTDEQAADLTAFLMSLAETNRFELSAFPGSGDPRLGKEIVETIGCMACHTIGDNTLVREARGTSYDIAPELSRVGSKVSEEWLYDWIRNPRRFNPTTRMPSLRLTDVEARHVVAYLKSLTDERPTAVPALELTSAGSIKRGEALVRAYGCGGCHAISGMEKEGRVSVSLSNFGRKKVEEMDFGDTRVAHTWRDWVHNKLKNSRVFATDRIEQRMPVFSFSDEEIDLLQMVLLSLTKDEPDRKYARPFDTRDQWTEAGRRIAYQYNCQQCHDLEKKGAYIGSMLEDVAFLPPPITGEGSKVQEPWLHDFLQAPSRVGEPNSIRPWIKVRMPTFGLHDGEITSLMQYFLGLSNQNLEMRDYASFRPDPDLVSEGRMIFNDFQCAKCHPTGKVSFGTGEVSTQDLAPDLTKARSRLKPEWIIEWLADPGKIQEGTRMPTFFPDGQTPLPDVLDGDARKQMTAIRDYLMTIGHPGAGGAGMP